MTRGRGVLLIVSALIVGSVAWFLSRYTVRREFAYTQVWELDAAPYSQEAVSELMAGKRRHAKDLLERALRENPESASVHYNLGVFYQSEGERTLAAEHFREALRLKPDHANAARELKAMERL